MLCNFEMQQRKGSVISASAKIFHLLCRLFAQDDFLSWVFFMTETKVCNSHDEIINLILLYMSCFVFGSDMKSV